MKAATLGNTEAQYQMGAAYRAGDGVPKDIESSLEWYRKAAAKHHPKALHDLAVHFMAEKTNPASLWVANDYWLQAAKMGDCEAQFVCSRNYFKGDVGPQDIEAGKRWLATAAENGWAQAEYLLFYSYFYGVQHAPRFPDYPKDSAEAIKWLRRAAEHESLEAQAILAVMLVRGTDVQKDKTEAERLWRNAAGHGFVTAQNDLGFAILNGDTSNADLVEAAMWCRLAELSANDTNVLRRAKVNASRALSGLTADQTAEVERRVKEFKPVPLKEPERMVKDWEKNPDYELEDGCCGR